MDLGLRDKVCVVTGSTAGIGEIVARALLEEGATVAIVAGASRLAPAPTRDRRAGAGRRAFRTLLFGARTLCAATICAVSCARSRSLA